MSLEDFHLLDNEPSDNSMIKCDFFGVYHQQVASLNDPDQNMEFICGENSNYPQIGNAYVQYDITVRKMNVKTFNAEVIRLINNAFA